jgi:hypothetical protein
MKPLSLNCPVCSEKIVLTKTDFEHVECHSCKISFAGFELFDSLLDSRSSNADRILPFGVMVSKKLKLDILRRLLQNMERVFELVVTGDAPGKTCSEEDLVAYLVSLVEGQRGDLEKFMPGSWTLVPHGKIPTKLHEEFVYLPTYLAVGTLSFILQDLPSLTRDIAALKRSLIRGLNFATTQGLAGRGYEWLDKRQQIFTIFERGKVLDLLLERPSLSPRMCYVLGYIHQRTAEILAKTDGPIEYETKGPVPRSVYERIADLTARFKPFCAEEQLASVP